MADLKIGQETLQAINSTYEKANEVYETVAQVYQDEKSFAPQSSVRQAVDNIQSGFTLSEAQAASLINSVEKAVLRNEVNIGNIPELKMDTKAQEIKINQEASKLRI